MGKWVLLKMETIGKHGKQIKNEYNDDTEHTLPNFLPNELSF